jgi:WD40 repeat protein/serine/threonine protein kinase
MAHGRDKPDAFTDKFEKTKRLQPEPGGPHGLARDTTADESQRASALEHDVTLTMNTLSSPRVAVDWVGDRPDRPVKRLPGAGDLPPAIPAGSERVWPGMVLGQYELIRELGRGGMGAVYLARDTRLGRRVAVKILAHDDESVARRFLAEARATARCKHDNIVDIYDVGEASDFSYMVLEYVEGTTLRAWLRERWQSGKTPVNGSRDEIGAASLSPVVPRVVDARVSAALAVEMMVPVVRGLAHAHGHGLVHRDLKPTNIMLASDGAIKVLDFGVAKVLGHEAAPGDAADRAVHVSGVAFEDRWTDCGVLTREGALVGTMPYMSPEQWGVDEIDERSDIWAVGIILWELVTGRHPLEPLSLPQLQLVSWIAQPMPSLSEQRPDLMPLSDIIDRCLRKPRAERIPSARALLAELEPLLPGRIANLSSEPGEPSNPYPGLSAFQESDAERFFGRERDVTSMIAQLGNRRMIVVAGVSGAGKSSFIRAGVIPALKRSGQRWESFIIRPGREPLAALASVLAQVGRAIAGSNARTDGQDEQNVEAEAAGRDTLIATLRARPGLLGAALRGHAQRHARILLFVDQFEELYTLGADRETREAFVQCLEGVADDASSPLRVVLSLRLDFLGRLAEDRAFTSEITRALVLLPSLGREELRETLVRPLAATGHGFESEALVTSMLDTLDATRAPLPLLQFTAAKLWESRDRDRRLLTQASYDRLGGVGGALATHADAVLAGLSVREQRLARIVFTSLVTEERTRAIVSLAELCAMEWLETASPGGRVSESPGGAMEYVVQHLAQARLLLIETDADRGGQTVEISHESLIDTWPRLGSWLAEDEEVAAFQARLRAAAREWDKRGRSEDLLWRGQAAGEAARWLDAGARKRETATRASRQKGEGSDIQDRPATGMAALSLRDWDYLHAVVALAAQARRRRRQVLVTLMASLGAVALAVSFLALRASQEARRAEEQAIQARNAGRMAAAREHQSDPTLALALLREIDPSHPPKRWEELARSAIHQGVARVVLIHPDRLYSAAFSRDGKYVVTASGDGTARVWSADGSGQPLVLAGHRDAVWSATFSPDGKRVVTASGDNTARVWNADGSGQPLVLAGHRDAVWSAAFSPDGKRVVTASGDNTARVWNVDGSGQPLVLAGHQEPVSSAAFSADGERIVTASWDKTVRVWNADGSGQPLVLAGHQDTVWSTTFSPDGKYIVTASGDKTVRVWNADGTGEPLVFAGHQDVVWSAAFSPGGKRIVTASVDKTVRVWNADGTGQPLVFAGHQDPVSSAAFSSDGELIVTASWDKSARVWNASDRSQPVVLAGHQEPVSRAAFSPDGERIVTASWDKTVRVWNADGTGKPLVLAGHQAAVYSASFSPDGKRVVSASWDKTVRVWNTDGTGQLLVFAGHQAAVHSASFSPDGERIVTASLDETARVWNVDGAGQPLVFAGHQAAIYSASFSPDGERIVTASEDKTARVWNVDVAGPPLVLAGHQAPVHSAAFSPDGKRIVTASADKTVRVWNANGAGQPLILAGHQAPVYSASFSPDGTRIVAVSDDKTIRMWNADGRGQPVVLLVPNIDAWSASFSPDGQRIASASHPGNTVWMWPAIEPLAGFDDPALWLATSYCPPIELRLELLGVPEHIARRDFDDCQRRVAEARATVSPL